MEFTLKISRLLTGYTLQILSENKIHQSVFRNCFIDLDLDFISNIYTDVSTFILRYITLCLI